MNIFSRIGSALRKVFRREETPKPPKPKKVSLRSALKKFFRPTPAEVSPEMPESVPVPTTVPESASEEEVPMYVDIIWDELMSLLSGAPMIMDASMPYYNPGSSKHGGRRMSEQNAISIEEILKDAESRLGREETVSRLVDTFGKDRVRYEIERLVYAVYDREFSRWGGGGFSSAKAQLQSALS